MKECVARSDTWCTLNEATMEPVWDDAYLAQRSGQSQKKQVDPKFPIFWDANVALNVAVRVVNSHHYDLKIKDEGLIQLTW